MTKNPFLKTYLGLGAGCFLEDVQKPRLNVKIHLKQLALKKTIRSFRFSAIVQKTRHFRAQEMIIYPDRHDLLGSHTITLPGAQKFDWIKKNN